MTCRNCDHTRDQHGAFLCMEADCRCPGWRLNAWEKV